MLKGIDVSANNGNINWKAVAIYGMGFVIIRITEKGNIIDPYFERNYKGCVDNGIPVGVYKYSYALNVSEAQAEAQKVLSVLKGRKLDYPVWLDLEWKNQKALGKKKIEEIAIAFADVILAAGYKFGIYCNTDEWYEAVISDVLKSRYEFWVARY